MLRLEAFLDDNKAAKVLHALDGLVIQLTMMPVKNAVKKGKNVVGANEPTTAPELIASCIMAAAGRGEKLLYTKDVVAAAKTYGVSKTALGYGFRIHIEDKTLKRKSNGVYSIIAKEFNNG